MALFLLESTVLGTCCVLAACGLGYPLASRLLRQCAAATRLSAAFLLGTALLSYGVMAIGLLGGLRPWSVLALLLVLSVPSLVCRRALVALTRSAIADAIHEYRHGDGVMRTLMIVALGLTALSAVAPLLPVTNADALAYATAVPARFARDGAIQFYPDSFESAFIMIVEQLHAVGYVFGLRPVGAWFELVAQLLLFVAVADCYRAFWADERRGSAYVCSAALLVVPLTQLMPFMVKAHLFELLAVVVVLTTLFGAPERGGWAGAGACAGVGIAAKYSAGPALLALAAPVAVVAIWRARDGLGRRTLLGAAACLLLFALPLYLRNWWWTGDPMFPMPLPGVASAYHLRHHDDWLASLYYEYAGFGRRPLDLLLWWPRAAVLPVRGSASYMGTFALGFLPLCLLRPRARHTFAVLAGVGLATLVLFVLGSQVERYLIAPIFGMTLLAAAGWDGVRRESRSVHTAGAAVLVVLALAITLPQKAYGLFVQMPALASADAESRVIALTTPWYDDLVRMRDLLPAGSPALCLLRNCQYLDEYRREDILFRLTEANQTDAGLIDPRPVHAGLRAQNVRYIAAYDSVGDGPPVSVVDWLASCGGSVVYRNPHARFGTRDPRRVRSAPLRLIAMTELTAEGASLTGHCGMPAKPW